MTLDPLHRACVLDADRDLASSLDEHELSMARRYAIAEVVHLSRGKHDPRNFDGEGMLGLLMLDGLLIQATHVADRQGCELLSSGALLRPWEDPSRFASLPCAKSWHVLRDVRLARLDRQFVAAAVRWPALIERLTARASERIHMLAFSVALHNLRHVELRLLVLLWHLADRFGRVTPEGVHVPLELSHTVLAALVGAARPSVSVALKRLSGLGLASRCGRTWLLSHEPPDQLRDTRAHHHLDLIASGTASA